VGDVISGTGLGFLAKVIRARVPTTSGKYFSQVVSGNQGRIQGVCMAVMTDHFVTQVGYSASKPMIKYQTL